MKRYLMFGVVIFGLIGCASTDIKVDNTDKNETIKDINSTKKTKIVDLDKELKEDFTKGILLEDKDKDKTIPVSIYEYRDPNDEVAFTGKIFEKAEKIKIGANDEVALKGATKYIVKTSELKDGDIISLIDPKKKILIKMKIRTH